jgi:hypothetical protein
LVSRVAPAGLSGSSSDVMLSSVSASMPPLLMSDSEEDADSLRMTGMRASAVVLMLVAAAGAVPSSFVAASARWAFLDLDRSLLSSF